MLHSMLSQSATAASTLSQGYDTICCSSCSLYIRVLYEAADDALHAQDPPRPGGS